MYSKSSAVGFKRCLIVTNFLEDEGKTRKRSEMPRLKLQSPRDICERRTDQTRRVVGRGTGVEPLGELRRVLGQRREMLDRRIRVLVSHRVASPL